MAGLYEGPRSTIDSGRASPHMLEHYVSWAAVMAGVLWASAAALVLAVWILAGMGASLELLAAVSVTVMFVIGVAVVCQIRLFSLRVQHLIRVASGLKTPDAELHTIGGRG